MSDLEAVKDRIALLEQFVARVDEKLSILPKIEAQLAAQNSIFITKSECEMQHRHSEQMRDELNRSFEKELTTIREECKKDLDGIAQKYSSLVSRIWAITTPIIIAILTMIVIQTVNNEEPKMNIGKVLAK